MVIIKISGEIPEEELSRIENIELTYAYGGDKHGITVDKRGFTISNRVEPLVMLNFADIKKEYELYISKQLGTDDEDDWGKVVYIDFDGLWIWIEQKLKEVSKISA